MDRKDDAFKKLWTELETLDRDHDEAKRVQSQRGFLGTEHAERLLELRRIQIDLAKEMTREESNIGLEQYRELWGISDPGELFQKLSDDRHFELLNDHVNRTSEKLDEIAAIIDASELQFDDQNERN